MIFKIIKKFVARMKNILKDSTCQLISGQINQRTMKYFSFYDYLISDISKKRHKTYIRYLV